MDNTTGAEIRATIHDLKARTGSSDARVSFQLDGDGNLIATLSVSVRGCRVAASAAVSDFQTLKQPLNACIAHILTAITRENPHE